MTGSPVGPKIALFTAVRVYVAPRVSAMTSAAGVALAASTAATKSAAVVGLKTAGTSRASRASQRSRTVVRVVFDMGRLQKRWSGRGQAGPAARRGFEFGRLSLPLELELRAGRSSVPRIALFFPSC